MFRAFSFDAVSPPAYSVYEAERAAMNVSPTSKPMEPLPSSPPPSTMAALAVQLHHHTLCLEPSADAPSTTQTQHPRPTYSRAAAAIMRMQRQASSRMQCCESQLRHIDKLVRIIEAEEQCIVKHSISRTCSPPSSSSTPGHDEGIDMDYDSPRRDVEALARMPQWTSGQRRDSCVRVTKPVRMRKRCKEKGLSKRTCS